VVDSYELICDRMQQKKKKNKFYSPIVTHKKIIGNDETKIPIPKQWFFQIDMSLFWYSRSCVPKKLDR